MGKTTKTEQAKASELMQLLTNVPDNIKEYLRVEGRILCLEAFKVISNSDRYDEFIRQNRNLLHNIANEINGVG